MVDATTFSIFIQYLTLHNLPVKDTDFIHPEVEWDWGSSTATNFRIPN